MCGPLWNKLNNITQSVYINSEYVSLYLQLNHTNLDIPSVRHGKHYRFKLHVLPLKALFRNSKRRLIQYFLEMNKTIFRLTTPCFLCKI